MSHWTTSGRSRLKAKQKQSHSLLSKRGRQARVAIAARGDSMMLLPTVPREITIGADSKKYHPAAKRRRKDEARKRYSSCNPIARRGVVVSIGSASIHHNHSYHHYPDNNHQNLDENNHNIESGISIENSQSADRYLSGDPSAIPYDNDLPLRPRGRRIRDANKRYQNLKCRESSRDHNTSRDTNMNCSDNCIVLPYQSVPYQQQQQFNGSVQHQTNFPLLNNVINYTNEDVENEIPNQMIPHRHCSPGRDSVAPLGSSNGVIPSADYANYNLESPFLPNHFALLPESEPQIHGMKRFQNQNVHDEEDSFEGRESVVLNDTLDGFWGNSDRLDEIDCSDSGHDASFSILRDTAAGGKNRIRRHCDVVRQCDQNDELFERNKEVSQNAFNFFNHDRKTDASKSFSLEDSYLQSPPLTSSTGIKRFSLNKSKCQYQSEVTDDRWQKSWSKQNDSDEKLEQARISADVSELSALTSPENETCQESLRFFNEGKEVSISLAQEHTNFDKTNEEEIMMMHERSRIAAGSPGQQLATAATSPDTDYLRGIQFENKTMWRYFSH